MSIQLIQQYHAQVNKIIRYAMAAAARKRPFVNHLAHAKGKVIDLLERVTAVSLQTMHIIHAMGGAVE